MKVRLLGAHNLETRDTRHTCFLVDGRLAIDAGSLVTGLTSAEIEGIETLLVTHHHFDHIRDIPTVGLVRREVERPLALCGLPESLEGLRRHVMDGTIYPDMTRPLNDAPARFRNIEVTSGEVFKSAGAEIKAVPVAHPLPAVGYLVRSGGDAVGFTGDTGGDILPFLRDLWRPRALFVDMTFPNRLQQLADITGHMTPASLKAQLQRARIEGLPIPKIVAVHRGLGTEAELLRELAHVMADLGLPIVPGYHGMVV